MLTPELHQRVRELYARVDAEVAAEGPRCDSSGRCCRFKEYDHTLFISHIEAEVLLASAPSYSKPVTNEFCPFQVGNLCTAREPRPLGCRIYFCDPTYQERSHEITESALKELKLIAEEEGLGWRYAPLHVFLNEAERAGISGVGAEASEKEGAKRVALPLLG
jgi:hypothetical protein